MIRLPTHPNPVIAALAAAGLASAGVLLLYGRPIGLGLPLFLAAIAGVATLTNRVRIPTVCIPLGILGLSLALLPSVEETSVLATLLGLAALGLYTIAITGYLSMGRVALGDALIHLGLGAFTVPSQIHSLLERLTRAAPISGRTLAGWTIPVGLGLVFVALFSAANPLVGIGLTAIPWKAFLPDLGLGIVAVWVALLLAVWPVVAFVPIPHVTRIARDVPPTGAQTEKTDEAASLVRYLDRRTIVRCLVLFNALFGLQTASDLAFLWGGASLPDGVSHAAYAHQGAYPLVVTALLAALFVLVALRPGSDSEGSALTRRLVYLWIAQTILLVISAMLRLDLYVATYALTLLRVAAFVWMGLVAVGLALIIARLALRRSNAWLIGANAAAVVLVLCACSFTNLAALVAETNVQHSLDGRAFEKFDLDYAMSLGPQAIPALDRYARATGGMTNDYHGWRTQQTAMQRNSLRDWRSWTYRGARLCAYLDSHTPPPRAATEPASPYRTLYCGEPR